MYNLGLVVEGGGMRGIYAAGVLDFFIDNNIYFKNTYGVSAGICHACSYLSKQRFRAASTVLNFINDKRYASFSNLIKTGDYFGVDMSYNLIPNKYLPFDYDTYEKREGKLYSVITNCKTGKAEYKEIENMYKDIIYVRASSSLPLLSRNVKIGQDEYLDGGIADSIPIRKAKENNKKNVVILTQCSGYRKNKNKMLPIIKAKYNMKYPNLVKAVANRHINYNQSLEIINEGINSNDTFVIRPSKELFIGRLEKDTRKLKDLYNLGYEDAKKEYKKLKEFLK